MEGSPGRTVGGARAQGPLELPVILLTSFTLVFGFVQPVVASPFYAGSESMVPTLECENRS